MDGDLRKLFKKNLTAAHWTSVETGTTAQGVPDCEYCFPGGHQGWVECKATRGWAVTMRPEQVGWLLWRSRVGGRSFIAVRQLGKGRDNLWIFHGSRASDLKASGLRGAEELYMAGGGPAKWDWEMVQTILEGL